MPHSIAVADVGGTHISTGIVDSAMRPSVRRVKRYEVDSTGSAESALDTLASALTRLGDLHEVGIALPGPFDYKAGIAHYSSGKFDALAGMDVGRELARRIAIDRAKVTFVKDADAYAVGEYVAGAAIGSQRAVVITLGTGIGSSFLDDGVPVAEGEGLPELGDVYTIRHEGHPLEHYVSRNAIRRDYQAMTGRLVDVHEIALAARNADPAAVAVLDCAMTWLASIVGPSIHAFTADRVVVGGSISRSWDVIGPTFIERLRAATGSPRSVVAGVLFDDAPLIGAAGVVSRRSRE